MSNHEDTDDDSACLIKAIPDEPASQLKLDPPLSFDLKFSSILGQTFEIEIDVFSNSNPLISQEQNNAIGGPGPFINEWVHNHSDYKPCYPATQLNYDSYTLLGGAPSITDDISATGYQSNKDPHNSIMRIVIIGAGPAGLVMAHCLLRAGIDDFVILERRKAVVESSGAGLGLWPHSVRVMDQLGLLGEMKKLVPKMDMSVVLGPLGELLSENPLFDRITENHGHPFMLFKRMQFIQVLYNSLSGKERCVLTGKAVESIIESPDAVTVTCTDNSSYDADVLIGADGVHSTVRRLIFPEILASLPQSVKAAAGGADLCPFPSSFKCIFGCSPKGDILPAGTMIEIQRREMSWFLLTTENAVVWFFFIRLGKPTYNRQRYSEQEAEEWAEKYKRQSVWKEGKVVFGDLWETREQAILANLEEGVLKRWAKGRVVLLGDAVHKMTPNLAFGANNAIESAVVLTNLLHNTLATQSNLDTESIERSLSNYQQQRNDRANWCVFVSGQYTRTVAWGNWMSELLGRYIMPLVKINIIADWFFAPIPKGGVVLDFVNEKHHINCRVPWLNGAVTGQSA
ncbi:hypothetical protein BX600DRAFT_499833 [Xylariales sp. PMI_506]|nr:hypothetical protein BX600DRAFT_499833 [Xylariales sp. PMI_506]